jgi:hypothetical protein
MMDEYAFHDEPSPHAPFIAFRYNHTIDPTRRQISVSARESAGQERTKVSGPDYSALTGLLRRVRPRRSEGRTMALEPSRRCLRSPWGVLTLLLLSGVAMMRNGFDGPLGPPQPVAAASVDAAHRDPAFGAVEAAAVRPLPFSPAARIRIDDIGVDAPVTQVGLGADHTIEPPSPHRAGTAGWYRGAVAPGQRGTAVIVGHVDNASGPAVFYGLGALRNGRHIEVVRRDGSTAVFEVYGVEVFAKKDFPGREVYGATGYPELRVITCGGSFTRRGGYQGNVVAFARLVAARPAH